MGNIFVVGAGKGRQVRFIRGLNIRGQTSNHENNEYFIRYAAFTINSVHLHKPTEPNVHIHM